LVVGTRIVFVTSRSEVLPLPLVSMGCHPSGRKCWRYQTGSVRTRG